MLDWVIEVGKMHNIVIIIARSEGGDGLGFGTAKATLTCVRAGKYRLSKSKVAIDVEKFTGTKKDAVSLFQANEHVGGGWSVVVRHGNESRAIIAKLKPHQLSIVNPEFENFVVERAQSFYTNWFLDPIMFREYPSEMRKTLGPNLPRFSKNRQRILNKALDFIGINHYTSYYAQNCMFISCKPGPGVTWTEGVYLRTPYRKGIPIGEPVSTLPKSNTCSNYPSKYTRE
ncbi:hypothetical protein SOVF_133210 [Spinacia oleracea]|nr:hypothetical protein SOVF_133210 [Spinacia oleracea]